MHGTGRPERGRSPTTATAPLSTASGMKRWPSHLVPRRAKKRSPGFTLRESQHKPSTQIRGSPSFPKSSASQGISDPSAVSESGGGTTGIPRSSVWPLVFGEEEGERVGVGQVPPHPFPPRRGPPSAPSPFGCMVRVRGHPPHPRLLPQRGRRGQK